MASVKINKAAPEEMTAKATPDTHVVTDERGRSITLKKPPFLAQFHLTEALGETAENSAYMGMVSPVLYVAAIDGDDVMFPQSKKQVEAILQRLDADGYSAVMEGLKEHFAAKKPKGNGSK